MRTVAGAGGCGVESCSRSAFSISVRPRPTLRPVGNRIFCLIYWATFDLRIDEANPSRRAAFSQKQRLLRADAVCRVIGVRIDVSERRACTTALSSVGDPQV